MRIAVVDDHPLVFDALVTFISAMPGEHSLRGHATLADYEREVENGASFDLVLLDLGLPGLTGLQALENFRAHDQNTPVVVLSALCDRDTIVRALDLGAMGFIPKTSQRQTLIQALQLVASGGIYVPIEAVTGVGGDPPRTARQAPAIETPPPSAAPMLSGLTVRQRDVLSLLLKGAPDKVIARQLDLSLNTVKSHISAIFRVLGVNNRTQAVITAHDLGLRVDFGASSTGEQRH